jgi:hypothetical protein
MHIAPWITSIGIAVVPQPAHTEVGWRMGEDRRLVAAAETVGLGGTTLCRIVNWLDSWKPGTLAAHAGTCVVGASHPRS